MRVVVPIVRPFVIVPRSLIPDVEGELRVRVFAERPGVIAHTGEQGFSDPVDPYADVAQFVLGICVSSEYKAVVSWVRCPLAHLKAHLLNLSNAGEPIRDRPAIDRKRIGPVLDERIHGDIEVGH